MTQLDILELAKKGDADAIAHLLNQYLQPESISAQVSRQDYCLNVVLGSTKVLVQHKWAEFIFNIFKEIIKLNDKSIKKLKIYKRQGKIFDLAFYHEFELQKIVKTSSPKSPQSQNSHYKVSFQKEFSRKRVSEDEFKAALEKCAKTARKAYQKSIEYAKKTEQIMQRLKTNLNTTNSKLFNNKDTERFEFTHILKDIVLEVKHLSEESIEDLVSSLDVKSKYLEDYTIALFGRTKAGKSTIREALTRSDGGTIGKGSQRTTRDVKEYNWQGLRLLDTPGIEAYQGEQDTAKANEVIDQSDMLLFLTSDDSVQPGEFRAMAQLQQINKYFAVILNIKHDISKQLEDLLMFLDVPDIVFDEQRLAEHRNHIQTYVRQYLQIGNVDLACIHAQAGFLSTQAKYVEYSKKLWELSQIDKIYYLIADEIHNNGQKRRVSTFFNGSMTFISQTKDKFDIYQHQLQKQVKFMLEQRLKLKYIFEESIQQGKSKIKDKCEVLYNIIENQIGDFVDKYAETSIDSQKQAWQAIVNKKHIESIMKSVIDEIFSELQEELKEFSQQYEYDLKNIKIEVENINTKKIRKSKSGRDINWASVAVGAVGGAAFVAANWWNPGGWIVAAGWIATGVSLATKVASEWKNKEEDKEFNRDIEQENKSLHKQVEENKQETINLYQEWLFENIAVKYQNERISQVDIYIKYLSEIVGDLGNSISEIQTLEKQIQTDFCNWN